MCSNKFKLSSAETFELTLFNITYNSRMIVDVVLHTLEWLVLSSVQQVGVILSIFITAQAALCGSTI